MIRTCQRLARRILFRTASPAYTIFRSQSSLPHKEYFQRPGQFAEQYQQTFATPPPPAFTTPTSFEGQAQPSRFRRVLRSLLWVDLFALLGVLTGAALVTWDYLERPGFLNEEEENDLLDQILQEMREDPLVVSLIDGGWNESHVYPERSRWEMQQGLDFIYERLMGTQGITIKEFTHPSADVTILVFFVGDGLEGWPDTLHGGIISSMLLLAAQRHINRFYLEQGEYVDPDSVQLNVNFHLHARSADIYSILVPPAARSSHVDPATGTLVKRVTLTPMMVQRDEPPTVTAGARQEPLGAYTTLQGPDITPTEDLYAMATVNCQINAKTVEHPEPSKKVE